MALEGRLQIVNHQTDHKSAEGWNQNNPRTESVTNRVRNCKGPLAKEKKVGEQVNEFEKALSDETSYHANQNCINADFEYPRFEGDSELADFWSVRSEVGVVDSPGF